MQRMIVLMLVSLAALYVFWSLSGRNVKLATLQFMERALPLLRVPLGALRRRLERSSGCAACSASTAPSRTSHPSPSHPSQ